MKVAVVLGSQLPVPAVKGGAIETLVTNLVDQNEICKEMELTIISSYDSQAAEEAVKYRSTKFRWIKYTVFNKIINLFTRIYARISGTVIPHLGILQTIHILRTGRYDYIVVEGSIQMLSAISGKFDPSKILFHLHSATLFAKPEVFSLCKKVIVVSEYLKEQVSIHTGLSDDRTEVLKNCIDLEKYFRIDKQRARMNVREKYRIKESDLVVSFIGRIDEGKGVRELLRSLAITPGRMKYTLLIIGSAGLSFGKTGTETDYYKEIMALALSLKNNVIFTGFVHNNKIPEMLAATDILVVPSTGEEAQGLVVLEGFASGIPVITTDSGGIPENISTDCAMMVKRDENFIKNLSFSIQDLLVSQEKRLLMGEAGLRHALNYSSISYYRNFVDILYRD